jgi:hypothetical protein
MYCQKRDKTAESRESVLPNWRLPFWQDPVIRRQGSVQDRGRRFDQGHRAGGFSIERFTASQLVHLAADEGIGKGGVAPNQGFRKCRHRLANQVLELGGAKLF